MKFLKKRKIKKESDKWTFKVGSALGKKIDKIYANKKCRYIIIAAMLIVLFVFIVPIQNNIITVSILIVLFIISYFLNRKSK